VPQTTLTELVGCTVPIQQAPMGGVTTPELAAAVAEAGGIGSFPCFGPTPEQIDSLLDDLASRTSGVLAANFLTPNLDPRAIEAAARHVAIVDFFWAEPDPRPVGVAHEAGAHVLWQVGSVAEAEQAAAAGCDAVAVQGVEAGGHVWGESPLLPLLTRTLEVVDVPVIAAGISSPGSLADVLEAGAAGIRVGTRFIATEESGAHPSYIEAVVGAGPDDTEITGGFSLCPLCAIRPRARVLRSALEAARELEGDIAGKVTMPDGRTEDLPRLAGIPPVRSASGHVEAMAMYAGQSAGEVTGIKKAAEVVADLAAGL
jgi:nitronate monooxygenase